MTTRAWLNERPLIVALANPNGAGKSTFYRAHVAPAGLRLVNADRVAADLGVDAYAAAQLADSLRRALVQQRESFAFETVFSDLVGAKLQILEECAAGGYATALLFIGLASPQLSAERVAMRVSQGGHGVPAEKLVSRFPRTLANLRAAVARLPSVLVYDNSDLARPYRQVAEFTHGRQVSMAKPAPKWFREALRTSNR